MKKVFLIIMIVLGFYFLNSCKPENKICACGVKNPAKNLPWIAELIKDAPYGVIWLENYKGQDVFATTGMMNVHGPYKLSVLDCEGNHMWNLYFDEDGDWSEEYSNFIRHLKKDIVIYVFPDYPL
jgi:hypothetical protein